MDTLSWQQRKSKRQKSISRMDQVPKKEAQKTWGSFCRWHCAPPVALSLGGFPDSAGNRIGSAAEGPVPGDQPDDMATRACPGNHVAARTSRRAPGGDGMGSHRPHSVQPPGRRARRPASARPARGHSAFGSPVSQEREVSLRLRHEVLAGARVDVLNAQRHELRHARPGFQQGPCRSMCASLPAAAAVWRRPAMPTRHGTFSGAGSRRPGGTLALRVVPARPRVFLNHMSPGCRGRTRNGVYG